jgi:crossover junction endodeoxyribonuclease RuvC
MITLGVDPGSRRTGWGVIQSDRRRHRLLDQGTLRLDPRQAFPQRLRHIHAGVTELLERFRPEALAVEDVFHAKGARASLLLGHVRGVILLAGAQAGVSIHEFAPATVKQQVTGFGRAEKHQVALMVARLLDVPGDGETGDAADALAVALCHAQQAVVAATRT